MYVHVKDLSQTMAEYYLKLIDRSITIGNTERLDILSTTFFIQEMNIIIMRVVHETM